jgi:hypothetical protein
VQHSVPYIHTQNGLVESLIKRIKLIMRPLLHNCNLPINCWGHVVLHVADLIQLQLTAYHSTSPLYLVCGNAPSIFHLWKFKCAMYGLILPPKHTSMGPQRKLKIYVGYHSPLIIKYLQPLTENLFTTLYADCIFNEYHFLTLEERLQVPFRMSENKFRWQVHHILWSVYKRNWTSTSENNKFTNYCK